MGNTSSSTVPGMNNSRKLSDGCPVDHATREAYLASAQAAKSQPQMPPSTQPPAKYPEKTHLKSSEDVLSSQRVISSIPRSQFAPALPEDSPGLVPSKDQTRSSHSSTSAAYEPHSGSKKGRWIYPSEKMFFEAMRRKNYSPDAVDMATVVPIHNAVNERAWQEIMVWESASPSARAASEKCGGPKLRSFEGDSSKLSPRARINGWLGYERPFDRHDWIIERCPEHADGVTEGQRKDVLVEYVIDFYKGRGPGALNFYLDVRPKLNTFEGWRLRLGRPFGL